MKKQLQNKHAIKTEDMNILPAHKCDWCRDKKAMITDGTYVWCSEECKGEFVNNAQKAIEDSMPQNRIKTQKPSDKDHRPKITREQVHASVAETRKKLFKRLEEKGFGTWLSRHEILGFITEEAFKEVTDAVHSGTLEDVKQELIDVAVGCIFGVACINAGKMDW